jgi:hypothetical protein
MRIKTLILTFCISCNWLAAQTYFEKQPAATSKKKFTHGAAIWWGPWLTGIFHDAGAEIQFKNYVIAFHHSDITEFLSFKDPAEFKKSNSLLPGFVTDNNKFALRVAAGPALVEIRKRTNLIYQGLIGSTYNSETFTTAGLEFSLKGTLHYRNNGIGLHLWAILNPRQSYASASVFLQTGWQWSPASKMIDMN